MAVDYKKTRRRVRTRNMLIVLLFLLLLGAGIYFFYPELKTKYQDFKLSRNNQNNQTTIINQNITNINQEIHKSPFNLWYVIGIAILVIGAYYIIKMLSSGRTLTGKVKDYRKECLKFFVDYLNTYHKHAEGLVLGEKITEKDITIGEESPSYWAGTDQHKFWTFSYVLGYQLGVNQAFSEVPSAMKRSVAINITNYDIEGPKKMDLYEFCEFMAKKYYYRKGGLPIAAHKTESRSLADEMLEYEAFKDYQKDEFKKGFES